MSKAGPSALRSKRRPWANNEEHRRNQHRAAAGGISGILVTLRADKVQPEEAQQSGPKEGAGPTARARAFHIRGGEGARGAGFRVPLVNVALRCKRRAAKVQTKEDVNSRLPLFAFR